MDNQLLKTYYSQNPLMEEIYRLANKEQKKQLIEQQQRALLEKQRYEMKITEKMNEVRRMQTKDLSKIIVPTEIVSKPRDENEFNVRRIDRERNFNPTLLEYWKSRTNQPYKNILKNEDYTKPIKKKEDLIIYRINKNDKSELVKELQELQEKINKQNDDICNLYSKDKQNEYKKKFEYNNKYIFRIKYDPKDATELKEECIEEYKKKQEELEKGKKRIDEIIESLVESGTIVEENLNEYIKKEEKEEEKKEEKKEDNELEFMKFTEEKKQDFGEKKMSEEKRENVKDKYRHRQMVVKMMRK